MYSVAGYPLDGEVMAGHCRQKVLRSRNACCGRRPPLAPRKPRCGPALGAGSVSLYGWRVRDRSCELGLFGGGFGGLRCQRMEVEVHVALSTLCGFVPPGHPPAGGFPIEHLRRFDRAYGPGRRCVSRLTGRNGVRWCALRGTADGSPRWTRLTRFGVSDAGRQGGRAWCVSACQ